MAVKRVGILLPELGIYGGINIVLNWAVTLAKSGYHLDLILPASGCGFKLPFLSEEDRRLLHRISEFDARRCRYRSVIGTYWSSIALLAGLNADHYAWFMQAYEGQFLELNSPAQADFDELAASQMNVITTAHWLQQHILRHYNFEPKQTFCVISGLDRTLWKPVPRSCFAGAVAESASWSRARSLIPARTSRKPSGSWRGSAFRTDGSARPWTVRLSVRTASESSNKSLTDRCHGSTGRPMSW